MKNIVLLGGSNSICKDGLYFGLCQKNVKVTNLALGACSVTQNLYALKRNKDLLNNADLIITESNINDLQSIHICFVNEDTIKTRINLFYQELASLNKKVLVLILPLNIEHFSKTELINTCHRQNCLKYGFNFIDIQQFFKKNPEFVDFFQPKENEFYQFHQFNSIAFKLGENIVKNIDLFKFPKKFSENTSENFAIFIPNENIYGQKLLDNTRENYIFKETSYRVKKGDKIKFPSKYVGYSLLGVHSWNEGINSVNDNSDILIQNNSQEIKMSASSWIRFADIDGFVVDEESFASCTTSSQSTLEYLDLISFFLVKKEFLDNCKNFQLDTHLNSQEQEYDFSYLSPDLNFVKKSIQEYLNNIDKKQIIFQLIYKESELNFNVYFSAKSRVKNHLAYKIGTCIISYSNSLFLLLLLPFMLNYIKRQHILNKEKYLKITEMNPNLKLPKMQTYVDYDESLRIKGYLSYRLGKTFINTCEKYGWWGGGIIKFLFYDLAKIKRGFKKSRRKYE